MDCELVSVKESIDTSTTSGKLTFHLFASLAEFERELIRERTQAGLLSARARGADGWTTREIKRIRETDDSPVDERPPKFSNEDR